MSVEDFEKFQHITGNLDCHLHEKGCTHTQERSENVLIFHFWLTLSLHKQEVKTKAKLSAVWLNLEAMLQHIHKAPWQRLGDLQVLSV